MIPFLLFPDKKTQVTEKYGNMVVIDSWQCIKKYSNVRNAFLYLTKTSLQEKGLGVKHFLK